MSQNIENGKRKNRSRNSNLQNNKNNKNTRSKSQRKRNDTNVKKNKKENKYQYDNNKLNNKMVKTETKKITKIDKKNKKVKEYNDNKRIKKNKKAKKILIIIFIFAILICGIYLLLKHPKFNLYYFQVEGTSRYTEEEILKSINIEKGKNIFIETFKKKNNYDDLPYIQNINLRIILPSKIVCKVNERKSCYLAYDKGKNRFFKLDSNGYILEESSLNKKEENELLMYGITFDDKVVLGQAINEIDLTKINVFNQINNELKLGNINYNITKVNFENSLTTLTLNDKLNVVFPNLDGIKYKIALLSEILKNIGEDSVGVIDLTKNNPTYSSY